MKVLLKVLVTILYLFSSTTQKLVMKHFPRMITVQQNRWVKLDKVGKLNPTEIWVVSHKGGELNWGDLFKAPITLAAVGAGAPVCMFYTVKGGNLQPVIHWLKEIKDMVSPRTFEYMNLHEMGHVHHKHLLKMTLDTNSNVQLVLSQEYEADQYAIAEIAKLIKTERGVFGFKLKSCNVEAKERFTEALTDLVGTMETFYGCDLQAHLADRISHM